MIQIEKLDHIVLRSMNSEQLVKFYCEVLGCQVERRLPENVGLVQLRAGDALIDIVAVDSEIGHQGGKAPGREGRNMDHFCVLLETFEEDAIRDHLALHNVKGSELHIRYGSEGDGPSIYIKDPEGNTVELKGEGTG